MSAKLVMAYKLRQAARADYIQGYAARVRVEEGRIVLEDRRWPLVQYRSGIPGAAAIILGDLEVTTAGPCGWAVWAAVEQVDWWDTGLAAERPAGK